MSNKIHNNQLLYPLSGSFSGSFTGSFSGDGSELVNLPSGAIPTFQQVTVEGDTTTSNITVGGMYSLGDVEIGRSGSGAALVISSTGTGEKSYIRADNITADRELQAPNASGIVVISVNNTIADNFGNIVLTIPSTGSLATTGSNNFVGNQIITGSVTASIGFYGNLNGTASYATNALSASYAISSSQATSASYALSASWADSASFAISSSQATSASYALSASWAPGEGLSGGTDNYIPLWSSSTTLTSSVMFQSGSRIGFNTTTPSASYHIKGSTTGSLSSSILITNSSNSSSFQIKDNGDLFAYYPAVSPNYKLKISGSYYGNAVVTIYESLGLNGGYFGGHIFKTGFNNAGAQDALVVVNAPGGFPGVRAILGPLVAGIQNPGGTFSVLNSYIYKPIHSTNTFLSGVLISPSASINTMYTASGMWMQTSDVTVGAGGVFLGAKTGLDGGYSGDFVIYTTSVNNDYSENARFVGRSGNFSLGVGGSPTYKLHTTGSGVSGSLNINNQLLINVSGSVGVGVATPTSNIHIKEGTASANTSPLKFTPGTNLTVVENGSVEYDGTDYFVSAQSTRQSICKGRFGSYSGVGTATTTFTVTIGNTQPNTTYKVNITPTNALSAALFYVTNKTITTFDVVYLTGLTGTVEFDWLLTQ